MNEKQFEANGKTYVASEPKNVRSPCDGCAFNGESACEFPSSIKEQPSCYDVIFVEKQSC